MPASPNWPKAEVPANATGSNSLGPVTAPQLRREVGVRTAVKHWPPGPGFPAVTVQRLPSAVPALASLGLREAYIHFRR